MRTKFLSVIAVFMLMSVLFSSCLKSDDTTSEVSSSAMIYAFGLDTIYGKHYKFTIDHVRNLVYNADSLPVGADTIIDRILIDTLHINGWATAGANDTLFKVTDSVDLRKPLVLKIHALDGQTTREYTISVNVHRQDPDSLTWENMDLKQPVFSTAPIAGSQKAVILNGNRLLVYTSHTAMHSSSTNAAAYGWSSHTVSGLPADIQLASIVNFKETLYAPSADGKVYTSTDGVAWSEHSSLSGDVTLLIAGLSERMAGIRTIDGKAYFCTTDGTSWTQGEEVPDEFPASDIYTSVYATANGVEKAVLAGNTAEAGSATVPWFTMDGSNWSELSTTVSTACPFMENPVIMYYNDRFYMFGGDFSAIYTSLTGLTWTKVAKKFLLPEAFKDKGAFSLAVDADNYIWIVWGGNNAAENSVWRGRLNKLGFARK